MHRLTTQLHAHDADRISAHLLRLTAEDRSLRFAAGVVTDDTVRAYVKRIRFGHDVVLGLVSQLGQVYGFAHGCVFEQGGKLHVEVAFSVDTAWRGACLGKALMRDMQLHASQRCRDCVAVVGQCAARNWPMRRLFEGAGLALRREDDEVHAHGWLAHPQAEVADVSPVLWGSTGKGTAPTMLPCGIQ